MAEDEEAGRSSTRGRSPFLRLAYLVAIAIKGIDGALEAIAGAVVAIAGTSRIYHFVVRITAPEIAKNPGVHAAHLLRHGASALVHASHPFVVTYLLVHGFLKVAIAINLLRGRAWIFPYATLILGGFIAYMGYRLTTHWSAWLLGFALFDVLTLVLVLNEWRICKLAKS
jgi:uncharacterized membrane protein